MKVPVADLRPNPFRNMEHYPIDQTKVARLRRSIRHTSFWDNILARANDGVYQLAYGHHRLKALQEEMADATVDIPVRALDDAMMLKIMANENGEDWAGQTVADLETIRTTRQYLIEHPTEVSRTPRSTKDAPPGAKAIAAFLGGIWTETKVKNILDILVPIEKGEIDEQAVRSIPTTSAARAFVPTMRKEPVPVQRRAAAEVAKVEKGNKREVVERVAVRHKAPVPRTDRPKLEFAQYLTRAAKMADALRLVILNELWTRKAVLRQHAWDAFDGLKQLHALKVVLDELFNVNPQEFRALMRRQQNTAPGLRGAPIRRMKKPSTRKK